MSITTAHEIADHEETRTHSLRMLTDKYELLTLALVALKNGSPDVTAEYIERTLDAMSKEIDWLRDRPNQIDGL